MRYEVCNTGGYGSVIFDKIEEARAYMDENGYVPADVYCTVFAGQDEDGQDVYEDAEYFLKKDDLPIDWQEMNKNELLSELYGDGFEPCIHPRV